MIRFLFLITRVICNANATGHAKRANKEKTLKRALPKHKHTHTHIPAISTIIINEKEKQIVTQLLLCMF